MPHAPLSDLVTTRARIRQRDTDARSEMEACIAVSTSARCQHVFGTTRFDAARAEAAEL